ncbi:MAG: hypothetical protein ACAI44_18650 [Candidatus Sericytochromatia bacterium]
MQRSVRLGLTVWMFFSVLAGCKALDELILPQTQAEKIEAQIALERKKQELERLRRAGQPTPAQTAVASSGSPASVNQSPQIQILDAVLATTANNNDTVRIVVKASDADGDAVEYNWSSVYNGLSSTKGEQVVWFPGDQKLAGKTNIITVSVTDKKGGTSTASLNIFVQNDGTLLVREDTAHKPVLSSLLATRTDDGRVLLRATASDPAGGLLKYQWASTAGQLASPESAATIWQSGSASGEVRISLVVSNTEGLQTAGSFAFERQPDGELIGGFSGTTVSVPASGLLPPSGNIGTDGQLQFVGEVLVLEGEELFRVNPLTRTRKALLNTADLPNLSGVVSQSIMQMIYEPPARDAYLAMGQSMQGGGRMAVYRVNLLTGKASLEGTILIGQPINGVRYDPLLIFSQDGKLKTFSYLDGPVDKSGGWVLDLDLNLEQHIPDGIYPQIVSANNGKLLFYRGGLLMVYDFNSQTETELLDLAKQGLASLYLRDLVWNHKGDTVAFTYQDNTPGLSNGGSIYTVGLDGTLRQIKSESPDGFINLNFSLDDLYLSFITTNSGFGTLGLIALDRPDEVQFTQVKIPGYPGTRMEWIPLQSE